MVKVILGAQWGDEGKGKMVDYFAQEADLVIRYQGGSNAGHTIVNDAGKFALHLVPSGIFNSQTTCLLGAGVVLSPEDLADELKQLEQSGLTRARLEQQLVISERAHVVMPYHVILDRLEEEKRRRKIGTTLKGIGPAYVDKVARQGIQVGQLLHLDALKERIAEIVHWKNEQITKLYAGEALPFEFIWQKLEEYREQLAPYIRYTQPLIQEALRAKKSIVAEGQLGIMRDLDWGTYPYVTSSNPISSAVGVGSGLAPQHIQEVLGVCKAYLTTVGEANFPTRLEDSFGQFLREKGEEIGVTTGRPRHCGWLDLPALKYGAEINGYTGLILTKLDILSSLPEIKVCTAYVDRQTGERVEQLRPYLQMEELDPVYETLSGWQEEISACRTYTELPLAAQRFIEEIEQFVEVPIPYVSVGPHRQQTLKR